VKSFKRFKSDISRKVSGKVSREDQAIRVGLMHLNLIESMSSMTVTDPDEMASIVEKIRKESVKAIIALKKIKKEAQ